jgi:hypothetical protein
MTKARISNALEGEISSTLLHILPAGTGGVSDYVGRCVERQPHAFSQSLKEGDQIASSKCVLLHLSGYGYARKGAPFWLLGKMIALRPQVESLGIFFHEIYATGPPWRTAFWMSPAQRYIAIRMVRLCDYWITNRELSETWLRKYSTTKLNAVLPVFSNVGEGRLTLAARSPTAVVFGGPALRSSTYTRHGAELLSWARRNGISIIDIGAPLADLQLVARLKDLGVAFKGRLDAVSTGKILSSATFGCLTYDFRFVAKSGVFAAYSSYGLCPILFSTDYGVADGLAPHVHYIPGLPATDTEPAAFLAMSSNAFTWYKRHDLEQHVLTQACLWESSLQQRGARFDE